MNNKEINKIYLGIGHSMLLIDGELYASGKARYKDESYQFIHIPMSKKVSDVSIGSKHTILLTDKGEIFVCGKNTNGQLGIGKRTQEILDFIEIPLKGRIKIVSCGGNHTILYTNHGDIFVFGANEFGQLGLDTMEDVYTPTLLMNDRNIKYIKCGFNHSLIYKYNGELYGFGRNNDGRLGLETMNLRVSKPTLILVDDHIEILSCGDQNTAFKKTNGEFFVMGNNLYGQLGNGKEENIHKSFLLLCDTSIVHISCGFRHTIIYKSNGEFICFGMNDFGQLGTKNISLENNQPHFFSIKIFQFYLHKT
eukprot:TRINITY_DN284_c0_g1_i3.p1 TRINITY_DN284_c0_g1~~TRINITY_DN284_c0_g1_i3.p1  ORF type:complete len:308 (+),score=52.85 TRINITY_DN284_c0_g1_i3:465-1388(+)